MQIPHTWSFKSDEIAEGFNSHVREQLPWYDLTTGVIAHVARHYIPNGGRVYDIGASTGNVGRALQQTLSERNAEFIAIENSKQMASMYEGPGTLHIADAEAFDFKPFDLAVCFLTLMFIPPSQRSGLIARLRSQIRPGGALLVFDKCEAASGYVATVLWRLALAGKVSSGVCSDEIIAKELSLSGVQRPLKVSELHPATEIFRFGDFAGWIIES